MSKKQLEIYIDGASQGNPGHSGIGVVICENGQTIRNLSDYIGRTTNNVAEYTALIYALKEASKLKADTLKINTDSQLLARQLNRLYKVKSENIIGLFTQAKQLILGFKKVSVHEIPREENAGADKLAAIAIKQELKKSGSLKG